MEARDTAEEDDNGDEEHEDATEDKDKEKT
jgi:hypothetical protein